MNKNSLRGLILLAYLLVVILLTTLPSSVQVINTAAHLFMIDGHPNLHDAIGHGTLYGTLTALIYWALNPRIGFTRAFWTALCGAMLLGLTTELLQHFSPGRTVQLSDLLGNWFGIMTV